MIACAPTLIFESLVNGTLGFLNSPVAGSLLANASSISPASKAVLFTLVIFLPCNLLFNTSLVT